MDKVFHPQTATNGVTAGWELQNMLSVCGLITSAANTYRTFLVNQYGLLEARMSEASMTLALLKELVAYDTGSSS